MYSWRILGRQLTTFGVFSDYDKMLLAYFGIYIKNKEYDETNLMILQALEEQLQHIQKIDESIYAYMENTTN